MKNITSKDPRKKKIVEHIKKETGADRVTNIQEDKTKFYGRPYKYNKFQRMYDPICKDSERWLYSFEQSLLNFN